MQHNFKGVVAYDGSLYYGFQKTSLGKSIEGTLQAVIERITQESIKINGASRTDRGVHANGQVIHFFSSTQIPPEKLLYAINSLLPKEIRLLSLEIAPPSFHPTLDAKKKEYLYFIDQAAVYNPFTRGKAWHCHRPLNTTLMQKAALEMIGERDFSAFQNASKEKKDPWRRIETIEILEEGETLTIRVVGNNFLYKMVRNIVGTLVYVGLGKIAPEEIESILSQKLRKHAGVSAPAHGLVLNQVYY